MFQEIKKVLFFISSKLTTCGFMCFYSLGNKVLFWFKTVEMLCRH